MTTEQVGDGRREELLENSPIIVFIVYFLGYMYTGVSGVLERQQPTGIGAYGYGNGYWYGMNTCMYNDTVYTLDGIALV